MPLSENRTAPPCFDAKKRKAALRVHLPIAPRSNLRLRFGSPRPTTATTAVLPGEALAWLDNMIDCGEPVGMVGITGPGDPLATPAITLETLRLVRKKHPGLLLCLTTNGLLFGNGNGSTPASAETLDSFATELKALRLSHVTLLMDAVRPEVAEKLYSWIRPGLKTMPLIRAAALLMQAQQEMLQALVRAGITVKVNTTVYFGLNADHVEEIACTAAKLGASIMNILPGGYLPEDTGNLFDDDLDGHALPCPPGKKLLGTIRSCASRHLPVMSPFDECGDTNLRKPHGPNAPDSSLLPRPSAERPNVAVCSASGMKIDLHLGQAPRFLIYGRNEGLPVLLGARTAPTPGNGDSRWENVAKLLHDCFALLAADAEKNPRKALAAKGIKVILTDSDAGIDPAVDTLYGGGEKTGGGKKRT